MDLSKFAPHVAEAFRKFGEARYQDGLRDGKQCGRDEVMSGLNALRAFLPPATSAPPLPGLTSVGITPVMLSQPPVDSADGDTDPRADARPQDEFDLDGLVRELAGADDPQVRQQVLALAWTAVVEAYKENGKDPAPVLARLMEMARGGAVEAATDPDAGVWLAWQRQSTKSGGVKAVWDGTDGQNRKPLYGKSAESALRGQEKRGKQTEARARRDDLVAKLDPASGELFDEQDWDDFSGHLENLTGAELKELRQKIKSTLQDRANRGLLKAGKNKQVRVQNLQEGVKNLIQHAIERAELPDAGLDENEGKISNLIGSMGGIRPDDPDFQRLTGFSPREAVENGILPRSAVKKNGKRFLDLASAFKEEGHLYVQDQADGSAGDYDAALAEAILDGKKTANTDVYDPEKRWAEVMGRKSVAERLRLARLRRSDPAEFEQQKRAMMGEPEATGEPDPDEYADYLNMQDDATDEQVPETETPAATEFDPASVFDEEPAEVPVEEPAAETPVEQPADEPAEKPVAQMTADERQAELDRLMAEQAAEMDEDRPRKKKKRPAQASPETPPAPAKAAQPAATPPVTPPDPVPARQPAEAAPEDAETDEEFEARLKRELSERRSNFKQRREQLLAGDQFKVNLDDGEKPRSEKTIDRPKGRPLTEAEQERMARERIDASQPQEEDGPTAADLRAVDGEAEAAVQDASGEYADPSKPVVGQAGKTATEQTAEEKDRRIKAMQARIAQGQGLAGETLTDEDRAELADTDAEEEIAAQPTLKKAGRKRLADNVSAPFANRLTTNKGGGRELAQKAAKVLNARGVVPPVPKSVRDAFANAPDKDKLDGMWEQHVRQLAGETGPDAGPVAKRTVNNKAAGGGPKLLTANEMASWQPAGEFDTREEAEAAGGQGVAQSGGKWYAMNPRASAAESPPPQPETAPQTPQDDPEDIRSQIAALQAKLAASQKGGSAPRADAPPPPRAELEKAVRNEVKDGLAGEFANIRMVPIHKIRDTVRAKYGDAAASPSAFNDLLLDLRRDKVVKLVSIDDRSRATPEQLRDSVYAVGETFFYVEKGPNWNE